MKKLNLVMVILGFTVWISPAMAYIDPGSGSAIMSAIIGFFVAISITIKTYWYKIKAIVLRKKKRTGDEKESS
jgi:hypothetical protein